MKLAQRTRMAVTVTLAITASLALSSVAGATACPAGQKKVLITSNPIGALITLNGRTVADVLAVERKIVTVEPNLTTGENNWEIEFFNSDRYNAAREGRSPDAYRRAGAQRPGIDSA